MRSFLFTFFAVLIASTQLAYAAATIPDYRARVNTGVVKTDPRDARASAETRPSKTRPVQFHETPARH